jgi:hypothetical protein
MSKNTHPFGYKDYNDALHNGVQYTLDEVKKVKIGDKVIVLTMTDSDDDYSLENRLFEVEIDNVNPDGFDAGGYWVDFSDYNSEYFLLLHPNTIDNSRKDIGGVSKFPFGYKDYNDALHNGVKFTLDEAKKLKTGDKAIVLSTHDSDDDYSLENRLFEGTVTAFPDFVDVDGYPFEFNDPYFNDDEGGYLLHPKGYSPINDNTETVKTPVIGEFTPKDKFIEFIGGKGYINFIASEATIEGKYLSGLDLEDVTFKLTICDEGTVNLEEISDTNKTTKEQRGRLVDIISDKTVKPYRQRIIVSELPFRSIQTIKDKTVPLYLSVEYQKPIEKLGSMFDDEEVVIEPVEISDEQSSKLDMLMSLFVDDDTAEEQMEIISTGTIVEVVDVKKETEDVFSKLKKEKITELNNRLDAKEKEIAKFNMEISTTQKRIEKAQGEAKLLQDRIESLHPDLEFNGFYFNVSERLNEKITLEPEIAEIIKDKISKVKSISVGKFMKLFEDGEYRIRLGKKNDDGVIEEYTDYESLPEEVKKSLRKIGTQLEIEDKDEAAKKIAEAADSGNTTTLRLNYKLIYVGDMTWGDIVNKMIKAGFGQDSEFDKMSGSNSYKIYDTEEPSNPAELKHLDKFENFDNHGLTMDDLEDISEELQEFEESNGYQMGDKFLFSIYEDLSATNELGDPQIVFSVSPKSYFDKEGYAYDQHLEWVLKAKFPMLKQMGNSFEELSEGEFDFADVENDCHLSVDETIDILCKAGLIPCISYQNLCSQKDTQLFMDTLEKLGHKNLLIS